MNMKKLLILSLIWLTVTACSAQNKGPQATRTLKVSDFTKLSMGSAFKINVAQGSSFRVTVSGKEDDLEDLEYNVSRGTLKLGYKSTKWNRNREGCLLYTSRCV